MATGFVQRFKGKIFGASGSLFQFGKGSASFGLNGNIYQNTSAAGIGNGADTTEDTLDTYSLPPNALDIIGRGLYVYAFGSFANNAHSKHARLYFGSEVVDSGANTTTGGIAWALELIIFKSGASAQVINGQIVTGTTHGGTTTQTGAETDTAAITLKVTGQTGTSGAGDVLLNGWFVNAMN